MADLQELYQTIIMDHNKRPRHYGVLADFTHRAEGYNPICGDKLEIRLKLSGEQIEAIQFEAACCAICKASASMMTQALTGAELKAVDETRGQVDAYLQGALPDPDADDELAALSGVSQFPARIKCAQLPWQTLDKALRPKESSSEN